MDKPIVVSNTALPTTVGALLRYVLTLLAGIAITKKLLPADADVNAIVGGVVATLSAAYGTYVAFRNHQQKTVMAQMVPDSVAKIKS